MIYNDTTALNTPKTLEYVPVRKGIFQAFLFFLFMAVLFTRTRSAIIGFINLVAIIYTLSVATKEETFLLLLGLQFVSGEIVLKVGSSEIAFLIFAYLVVFIKYYFVEKRNINKTILVIIFFFTIEFINLMSNDNKAILSVVQWLLSFWYMYEVMKDDLTLDLNDLILHFILGVWTICVINILEEYFAIGRTLDPSLYGQYLDYSTSAKLHGFSGGNVLLRFGMGYKNIAATNGLAFDLALGMCLCLFGLTAKHQKYTKFYTITFISFFYFGFLTVSRGFYIELLILFPLFFISNSKNTTRFFTYLIIAMLVIFIFVVFVMDNVNILFDSVSERFDEGNDNRFALIGNSIKLFFGNDRVLLFGAGSQYPARFGFTAHNMIFDVLVSLGSFGSLLYFVTLFRSYKRLNKYYVKFTLFNFIPLIMLVSYRMISGCISDFDFYYLFMVCAIFTRYNYEGEGEKICITSH